MNLWSAWSNHVWRKQSSHKEYMETSNLNTKQCNTWNDKRWSVPEDLLWLHGAVGVFLLLSSMSSKMSLLPFSSSKSLPDFFHQTPFHRFVQSYHKEWTSDCSIWLQVGFAEIQRRLHCWHYGSFSGMKMFPLIPSTFVVSLLYF